MKRLNMVLAGPMASWCVDEAHRYRPTQRTPGRYAIVGFLACALGRRRGDDMRDLHHLDIEVANTHPPDGQEGTFVDYHTIRGAATYDGKSCDRTAITHRQYLTQVSYEVLVKGPDHLIDEVAEALRYPRWQLYLGRRSCPLSRPPLVSVEAA